MHRDEDEGVECALHRDEDEGVDEKLAAWCTAYDEEHWLEAPECSGPQGRRGGQGTHGDEDVDVDVDVGRCCIERGWSMTKKSILLELCVSSLRRGHAN